MSKEIIFRATNETGEKIEIYKDLKFSIFKNDKITSKGRARIVEEKILLTEEPKNIHQTLIQGKEYIMQDEKLCELVFTVNTDTTQTELRLPPKIINENNCYKIEINTK